MKQPTKEQIKEFWEWCGWKPIQDREDGRLYIVLWEYNGGEDFTKDHHLPPIDLNNLFKYAVPKLFELGLWYKLFSDDGYHFCVIYKEFTKEDVAASIVGTEDPALALFWAIYDASG